MSRPGGEKHVYITYFIILRLLLMARIRASGTYTLCFTILEDGFWIGILKEEGHRVHRGISNETNFNQREEEVKEKDNQAYLFWGSAPAYASGRAGPFVLGFIWALSLFGEN